MNPDTKRASPRTRECDDGRDGVDDARINVLNLGRTEGREYEIASL
jgi:hypothetical protein